MELKELKARLGLIMLNGADDESILNLCKDFAVENLSVARDKIYQNDWCESHATEMLDDLIDKIEERTED